MARVRILHVEDNLGDVELFSDALASIGSDVDVVCAGDGLRAMALLAAADQPRPDLVVLDLNLPRLDGFEVLARMKQNDATRRLPIVVLTTSAAPTDIDACYRLGAAAYLTKPTGLAGFRAVVAALDAFWVASVTYPNAG